MTATMMPFLTKIFLLFFVFSMGHIILANNEGRMSSNIVYPVSFFVTEMFNLTLVK